MDRPQNAASESRPASRRRWRRAPIVSRNQRSCETATIVLGEAASAASSVASVSKSRWLVGSSRSSALSTGEAPGPGRARAGGRAVVESGGLSASREETIRRPWRVRGAAGRSSGRGGDLARAPLTRLAAQHPLVADAQGHALGVEGLEQRLRVAAGGVELVAQGGERER